MCTFFNNLIAASTFYLFMMIGQINLSINDSSQSARITREKKYSSKDTTPGYKGEIYSRTTNLENDHPAIAKTLRKHFPNHSTPLLIKSQGQVLAYFTVAGKKTVASLTNSGGLVYSITNSTISAVPKSITERINFEYTGYNVYHVNEIITKDMLFYEIILENTKSYITLQINDDDIKEVQKITKTN